MCCSILWEVEIVRDELGYLAAEMSMEGAEGVALFLLAAYSKM